MDGVATPIIGRPRPLPGHDTPNPAYHPHTLNYEEPVWPEPVANYLQLYCCRDQKDERECLPHNSLRSDRKPAKLQHQETGVRPSIPNTSMHVSGRTSERVCCLDIAGAGQGLTEHCRR